MAVAAGVRNECAPYGRCAVAHPTVGWVRELCGVIPAEAGIQGGGRGWIPAFAGMTGGEGQSG